MQIEGIILSLHPNWLICMRVYHNFNAIEKVLKPLKKQGASVGFVPTMGALHQGHISLISKSAQQNDFVVVSIFVNPTQFTNAKDFDTYPRTISEDLKLLEDYNDNILIFLPEVKDIYPNGVGTAHFDFGGIENEMEGKFRPGHFDGVGTVLKSFFDLLQPDTAYFGEKDFQQLQIVKKLVEIEKMPVKIVGCPILREPSGLAMSSRNKRLNKKQLLESSLIFKTLTQAKKDFGIKSVNEILEQVREAFKNNSELELEYIQIAEETTLKPIREKIKNKKYRAFIAIFAGEVRLIDNIALN